MKNTCRRLGFATLLLLGSVSSANATIVEVSGVFTDGDGSLAGLVEETFSFQFNYGAATPAVGTGRT